MPRYWVRKSMNLTLKQSSWERRPRLEKLAWDLLNQVAKCGRRYGIDVKAVSPAAVLRKSQEECSTVDSSIL